MNAPPKKIVPASSLFWLEAGETAVPLAFINKICDSDPASSTKLTISNLALAPSAKKRIISDWVEYAFILNTLATPAPSILAVNGVPMLTFPSSLIYIKLAPVEEAMFKADWPAAAWTVNLPVAVVVPMIRLPSAS
ncbi:hypothetical protein COX22_00375, partial [Candidatus Falkowbacteria bacterium CG23_combo_of_CG06-09_8_20_14_all_49_15]